MYSDRKNKHSSLRITLIKLIFSFFKYLKLCLKTILNQRNVSSVMWKLIKVLKFRHQEITDFLLSFFISIINKSKVLS